MHVEKATTPPKKNRQGSIIWRKLNQGTARVYGALQHSSMGHFLTAYRQTEDRLLGNQSHTGRHRCAPASPARQRVAAAIESSGLYRGLRGLFGSLLDCPTACYGLFGLLYGLGSLLLYFLGPFLIDGFVRDRRVLIISALIAAVTFPLVLSRRSMAESLGRSAPARGLLIGFLGVPRDRLALPAQLPSAERNILACVIACAVGLATSVATLYISPWIIPAVLLAVALLGMIFTYPETGVVLFTLMLPLVWLDQKAIAIAVALILLTWCSFIVKLLTLHRAMHFGLLDRVVLILGVLIFALGFTGYGISAASIWQSVALTVCVSGYFLIVNLLNTRDQIRRCLVGVAISVVLVTLLACFRRIPVDNLLWLEGSRAGDAIIKGSHNAMERLSQLWVDHSELYLVLVFAWLYAYLVHSKSLIRKFLCGMLILLDLTLILMTDSVSALICVVVVTILFLLMLGHKWLSVMIIALPAVLCGAVWVQYLYPVPDRILTILSRSRLYKTQLTESLWQMVWDHPAGIGVGEGAFNAVYPAYAAPDLGGVTDCGNVLFELLLSFGWAGVLIVGVILFLFVQKSLSTLRHAVVRKDRAMILGGVTSILGLVIFGCVRSFITSPRVFFTVSLVIALCCAYENILCEESNRDLAEWEGNERAEDRFYRDGEFL